MRTHLAEAEAAHPELPRQSDHRGRRPARSSSGIVEFAREHELPGRARPRLRRPLLRRLPGAVASCRCPGAKDVGVEFFTLSKSYNMPGWRVGFAVGNREMIAALARIKSYLDYGIFQPIQIAAIARAERPAGLRRRDPRDAIASGATCCATGSTASAGTCRSRRRRCSSGREIPERSSAMGSLEFSKFLLREAQGRGLAGHRLRRVRRRLRALRADRERAPHPAGDPRHPEGARRDARRRPRAGHRPADAGARRRGPFASG